MKKHKLWPMRAVALVLMAFLSFNQFYFLHRIDMGVMWLYVGALWALVYYCQDRERKAWEAHINFIQDIQKMCSELKAEKCPHLTNPKDCSECAIKQK